MRASKLSRESVLTRRDVCSLGIDLHVDYGTENVKDQCASVRAGSVSPSPVAAIRKEESMYSNRIDASRFPFVLCPCLRNRLPSVNPFVRK